MTIIHEYDFNGTHYALVALDNGQRIEIKGDDPLTKAAEMQTAGAFDASGAEPVGKAAMTAADLADAEILAEFKKRGIQQIVRGVVI
jgi:hypothetical protein